MPRNDQCQHSAAKINPCLFIFNGHHSGQLPNSALVLTVCLLMTEDYNVK